MSHSIKHLLVGLLVVTGVMLASSLNAQQYKRHALLEEGTGTWCGYCPYGAYTIDSTQAHMGDWFVAISYHTGDPISINAGDTLGSYLGATGVPWAGIGRAYTYSGSYPSFPNPWYYDCQTAARQAPLVDFRIVNASYNASNHSVDFDLDITPFDIAAMPKEDTNAYVTVAVLTEDSIVQTQHRYAEPGFTEGDIDDFHHQNVAREVSTKILGDQFIMGTKTAVRSFPVRKHYHMTIDNSWVDANMKIKGFAARRSTKSNFAKYLDAGQTNYVTSLPAQAPDALWTVLPIAGKTYTNDSTSLQIVWATGGTVSSTVKIEYSVDSGKTWNVISASTNKSPYNWVLTPDVYGKSVAIRLTNGTTTNISGYFSVASKITGTLTFTTPAAGDTLVTGQSYSIQFVPTGTVTDHKLIELSTDAGYSWSTIGQTSAGQLSYQWHVIAKPAGSAALRISDDGSVKGVSGTFSIVPPGTVTSVNITGGSNLPRKTQTGIVWTSTGYLGKTVTIDYSEDGQLTWKNIVTDFAFNNTKQYDWTTPDKLIATGILRLTFSSGAGSLSDPFSVGAEGAVTAGAQIGSALYQNYPNPFAPVTTIPYQLSERAHVKLTVMDALGREVGVLVNATETAGPHHALFDAAKLSAGTYTYVLKIGDLTLSRRLTVLR